MSEPIETCEGCDKAPATSYDTDGIPLCEQCRDLPSHAGPPEAEGVETQKWSYEKSDEIEIRGDHGFGWNIIMGASLPPLWVEFESTAKVLCNVHNLQVTSVGRGNAANPPPGNPKLSKSPNGLIAELSRFEMAWATGLQRDVEPISEEAIREGLALLEPQQKEGYATCEHKAKSKILIPTSTVPAGNAASSNVRSVAAAAEDVAGEEWEAVEETIAHYCGLRRVEDAAYILWGLTKSQADHIADAHNSCVSHLQERADRFEKLSNVQHEWGCAGKQFTHIDNVLRLQEQIKTLEKALEEK